MIRRKVVLSPDAQADLAGLYDWIADQASPEVALAYIERLEAYVMGFEVASERAPARITFAQACALQALSAA